MLRQGLSRVTSPNLSGGACCAAAGVEYARTLAQPRYYAGGVDETQGTSDEGGRYGSLLLKSGRAGDYKKMGALLKVDGKDEAQEESSVAAKVTISIFQTLKYSPESNDYKKQLAAYRVMALGRDLQRLLDKTPSFLSGSQSSSGRPGAGST